MTVIGIAIIAFGLVIFLIYNKMSQLRAVVEEAFGDLDVLLKTRWELIPNLVETVRKYALLEQESLENMIRSRTVIYSKLKIMEKVELAEKMTLDIEHLLSLVDLYPALRSDETFVSISKLIKENKEALVKKIKQYNECVKIYNENAQQFINKIIVDNFGFAKYKTFDLAEEK